MKGFLNFLSTNIISSKNYSGTAEIDFITEKVHTNCICNIRYGDLIKNFGDILLCPLADNFIISNPFSRKVIKAEGKWLKETLKAISQVQQNGSLYKESKLGFTINTSGYIGTQCTAFLPC